MRKHKFLDKRRKREICTRKSKDKKTSREKQKGTRKNERSRNTPVGPNDPKPEQ